MRTISEKLKLNKQSKIIEKDPTQTYSNITCSIGIYIATNTKMLNNKHLQSNISYIKPNIEKWVDDNKIQEVNEIIFVSPNLNYFKTYKQITKDALGDESISSKLSFSKPRNYKFLKTLPSTLYECKAYKIISNEENIAFITDYDAIIFKCKK